MKSKQLDDKAQLTVAQAGKRGGLATSARFRGTGFYQRIGAKGGETTKTRWGHLFRQFGKLGGRPRRPTLDESKGEKVGVKRR